MLKELFSKYKNKPQRYGMIIAAGGSGERMQSEVNKLLLQIDGRSIIEMSIAACEEANLVSDIVIVANEDIFIAVSDIVKQNRFQKVTKIVRGGSTRIESVAKGMAELAPDISLVGIHDGARPFVTPDVIDEIFEKAEETGAAVVATRMVDTVKRQRNGVITEGLDRDEIVAVQTPQVFSREIFDVAIAYALDKGLKLTDDVGVYQVVKKPVHIVWGTSKNRKITTAEDLETN